MALYDGFFNAEIDGANEDGSPKYDREYEASAFTSYFAQMIGSGVCVYGNENSFRVGMADGNAVVFPGYLFIDGYWLRNDANYTVTLPGSGTYAIAAKLNTGARMIELVALSVAQSYPDSLVLAIVNTTDGTAEDTRYNTDICGVIDSAGSLSDKVEYAVNYIDNEIEGKLAAAEQAIAAQSARLDAEIAEVEAQVAKLAPPPIGTIKFSASQNVDEEWLQCDGSFINESDYPELVAALGKLTPGVDDFEEVSGGTHQGTFSNGVLDSGILWTFSQTENKLIGYVLDDKTSISIPTTGTDVLVSSVANSIVLSICDDHVFLTQNQGSKESYVLLEATDFSRESASLEFVALPASSKLADYLTNAVPEVVKVKVGSEDKFFMCYGRSLSTATATNTREASTIYYLTWAVDDFSSATRSSVNASVNATYTGQCANYVDANFRFNRKNSNELLTMYAGVASYNNLRPVSLESFPLSVYNTSNASEGIVTSLPEAAAIASPVAGNNAYIYGCAITNKKMTLRAGKISPNEPFTEKSSEMSLSVTLPSAAKLFRDSICFCGSQGLWVIFVGTGFVFSKDPLSHKAWGYLDTSDVLGVITQFGCVDFDDDKQILCISGRDTTNKLRVGFLKFDDIYNYANDGAWLPMIASDGVPAYIKGDSGVTGTTVPMTVNVTNNHATTTNVLFNGETLIGGTYTRQVQENGKFSVGISNVGSNYSRYLTLNGTTILSVDGANDEKTLQLNTQDYISNGITLAVSG